MWAHTSVTQEKINKNIKILSEHFNEEYADAVAALLEKIDKYYFRSQFIGFENFPARNNPDHPLLFISNHSGMAFPWDAMIFISGLYHLTGHDFTKSARALTVPILSDSVLMNPFLVKNFWKKVGGIDATFLNFETMMQHYKGNLLVYPEGVPGIGKGFDKRYRLQRFSSSFVKMSIKYKTDVFPVLTVNGEYVNPYNFKSDQINKLSHKIGIPFIPVGLMTLLIPFQPWIFYFGFPAKLKYIMGKRIKPYEMTDKPYEKITQKELWEITKRIRKLMQMELDEAVQKYGQIHYKPKELFSTCINNIKHFPYFIPCCWPSLFEELDVYYKINRLKSFKIKILSIFSIIRHNPIVLAFFIPILGWIPILIKGLRKVD